MNSVDALPAVVPPICDITPVVVNDAISEPFTIIEVKYPIKQLKNNCIHSEDIHACHYSKAFDNIDKHILWHELRLWYQT